MPAPENRLKAALARGDTVFGCWTAMASAYAAEIVGRAGFDWVLIDGEHAPNDLQTITQQLQVLDALGANPIVRLPQNDTALIKQVLDAGAQSLLIPLVESAAQAEAAVRAMRYPPNGVRGVGSALARSSRFSGIPDYLTTADAQMCLIVQVETVKGIDALDEILGVEGVDGVFIGPADLSADMGYLGNPGADEVQTVIADTLRRIAAAGKAPGIMTVNDADTPGHIENGARFLAVDIDVTAMAGALRKKAAHWREALG